MKEILHYFLDPWYYASKEEAEDYLRNAGINPESAKREFKEFIDEYERKKKLWSSPAR